jgi:hypothetical protein
VPIAEKHTSAFFDSLTSFMTFRGKSEWDISTFYDLLNRPNINVLATRIAHKPSPVLDVTPAFVGDVESLEKAEAVYWRGLTHGMALFSLSRRKRSGNPSLLKSTRRMGGRNEKG